MNLKTLMIALAAISAMALEAAVGVKNVICQQRYPWNGKVDIDYEVTSDDPNADVWVYPTGYDKDANVSMAPRALTGEGAGAAVKPGKHRMTWDVSADYPEFASTAFSVKMIALTGGAPYMVIDLSGGVDALSYPVSYLNQIPAGGWSDEYKTTKLVLRLIPPGTFVMGSPSDELGRQSYENQHTVTLTQPYYMGVFEVTRRQYELVLGSCPSTEKGTGNTLPVYYVTYNAIRGTVNGAGWPSHNQVDATSFMGRIRSKANVLADLPTEAQWEYACRAGTATALNNGKNLTTQDGTCANLSEVAWYYPFNNSSRGDFTTVGRFKPNAWGIYDMHGNAMEWCRDWYNNANLGDATDPKGPSSGSYRVLRGGGCSSSRYGYARYCRSAWRYSIDPSNGCNQGNGNYFYNYDCFGFRLAVFPVVQ